MIIYNPSNKATRFSSLAAIFGGLGGLAEIIILKIIPFIAKHGNGNAVIFLTYTASILNSLAYYGAPYFLLIFSILYSDILRNKKKYYFYLIHTIMFVSVLFMYVHTSFYPEFSVAHLSLLVWVTPYFVISDVLLLYSVFTAKDPKIKKQRHITCFLLVPLVTALYFFNYICLLIKGISRINYTEYNDMIGVILLFGFIFLAARYGFLGIKIEVSNIEHEMKIATLGTNLINHSIKNELAKIKICLDNLLPYIIPNPITQESFQITNDSLKHIQDMITRIQEKTQTIVIKEELCNLSEMIRNTLNKTSPLMQNRNIVIHNKINSEIICMLDKVHFQEVLLNIIKNAIEAIPVSSRGYIKVDAKLHQKQIILEIQDNGPGISREVLLHIFEPFFSTKHMPDNYGLGLAYSLNVLQKSGGTIEIKSQPDNGTIVFIKLPMYKCIQSNTNTKELM